MRCTEKLQAGQHIGITRLSCLVFRHIRQPNENVQWLHFLRSAMAQGENNRQVVSLSGGRDKRRQEKRGWAVVYRGHLREQEGRGICLECRRSNRCCRRHVEDLGAEQPQWGQLGGTAAFISSM
jgi:hypothetical protein